MITGVTGTTERGGQIPATTAIPGTEPEPGSGISRITYREPASFQDAFLANALEEAKKLAALLRGLSRAVGAEPKHEILSGLQSHAERLNTVCSEAGWPILGAFLTAMSKLFRLLQRDTSKVNASTLRTAANAVDFLTAVFAIAADLRSIEKAPLRALVIDDNDTCRRAVELALHSEHLQVCSASSGEEAIENLRQNDYDVIFTDIMMPRVNGFALLKILRGLPNHARTPVVFVTALSDFETRSRSILSGGCDLVAKPITPSEVLLKAFTFALRSRFPECRRKAPKTVNLLPPGPQVTGVLKLDERATIQTINDEAAQMFGFKPGEILGIPILRLFPRELQAPEYQDCIPSFLRGEGSAVPYRLVACRKNSSVLQVLVTLNPPSNPEEKTVSLLLRYANAADVPQQLRDAYAVNDPSQKNAAPRPQPVGSADLAQTLDAVQTQLRLQLSAHATEARQLQERIASLERELDAHRKREASMDEELKHEREARRRLEVELKKYERTAGNA